MSTVARILVVDDDPDMLDFTVEALNVLGHEVLSARDSQQALDIVASGAELNALVTDVKLPGTLDGAMLAIAVHRQLPGLPIIFVSGYAEASIVADALKQVDGHFLPKPFRIHQIEELLTKVLAARRAGE